MMMMMMLMMAMMAMLQVKRAYLIKLRYLKKVASSDGTTHLGLDGYASKYWLGLGVTDLDTESVQEIFMQAASVFNRCVCARLLRCSDLTGI